MIRVLIRALPDYGPGRGLTLGQVDLHPSNQLRLLGPHQGFDVALALYRPPPFDEQVWKRAELEDFDPHIFSPYDLLYQALHKVLGPARLDSKATPTDIGEAGGAAWWLQAALRPTPRR